MLGSIAPLKDTVSHRHILRADVLDVVYRCTGLTRRTGQFVYALTAHLPKVPDGDVRDAVEFLLATGYINGLGSGYLWLTLSGMAAVERGETNRWRQVAAANTACVAG